MTLLETIVKELSSAPEPLLLRVLELIQTEKSSSGEMAGSSYPPRIPGLHSGKVWMSEDFDDPLPDEFWLGEDA